MKNLISYYSRRAAEYDEIYDKPERRTDLAALGELLRSYLADQDVFELACGTGYWTAVIADHVRSMVATDAGEAVLDIARSRRLPPKRVRLEIADAYAPETVNGSFTGGLAAFWWSHVPRERLPAFLGSFFACLQPGSRVVFCDNREVAGHSTPISRRDSWGNTYQVRTLRDGSRHEVIKNYPDREEFSRLLPECTPFELTDLEFYWCVVCRIPGA